MNARVVYIGEKLLAGGLALSGVRVFTPVAEAEAIWSDFKQAHSTADLVLISAEFAELLGKRLERVQQLKPVPPVLRLPAAYESTAPVRETLKEARASLGLS